MFLVSDTLHVLVVGGRFGNGAASRRAFRPPGVLPLGALLAEVRVEMLAEVPLARRTCGFFFILGRAWKTNHT